MTCMSRASARTAAADIPRRRSLVAQTVDFLRAGISDRHWETVLPGERELCRNLQIGRNTLRRALAELEAERWIGAGGSGRRRRVLRTQPLRPSPRPHRAVFLTGTTLLHVQPSTLLQLDLLREHLGALSIGL